MPGGRGDATRSNEGLNRGFWREIHRYDTYYRELGGNVLAIGANAQGRRDGSQGIGASKGSSWEDASAHVTLYAPLLLHLASSGPGRRGYLPGGRMFSAGTVGLRRGSPFTQPSALTLGLWKQLLDLAKDHI